MQTHPSTPTEGFYRWESDTIGLIPLSVQQLEAFNHHQHRLIEELGLQNQELYNPDFLMDVTENLLLPRMLQAAPQLQHFYTKWLAIDKKSRLAVGEFILKTGPEPEGEVEIGYGIYPEFEGQGYMTQIVGCFLQWARATPEIKKVVAETEKQNKSSIRVLEKNGFSLSLETEENFYWTHSLTT